MLLKASQVALGVKNLPANSGDIRDSGSIPGSGRSPGGGNGNPCQNSMDRGVWWATVQGVSKSWTQLSDFTFFLSKPIISIEEIIEHDWGLVIWRWAEWIRGWNLEREEGLEWAIMGFYGIIPKEITELKRKIKSKSLWLKRVCLWWYPKLLMNNKNTNMEVFIISISNLPLLITVRSDPEQMSSTM